MAAAIELFEACEPTGITSRDRLAWLRARRGGIGGSDAAAMMGVSAWTSELALFVEKTSTEEPDEASAEVALWGHLLEPTILREYDRRSKRRVVRGGHLLRSRQVAHRMVTLDGVATRKPPPWARGKPGIVEVKTTGYAERYEEDLPVEVQIQIQWELLVTGAAWATCVWLPLPERRLQWIDVEPHPAFQETLAERAEAFWRRVESGSPPDPDGSESSMMALRKLFPEDNGEVIRLAGATDLADEYERNRAAIKLLQERQGLIKNMLAATIRDSKYAILEDGRYWGTAAYRPREQRCPHCSEVLHKVPGYRTYTLREPRKKPFPAPATTRELRMPGDELAAQLAESLAENAAQKGVA